MRNIIVFIFIFAFVVINEASTWGLPFRTSISISLESNQRYIMCHCIYFLDCASKSRLPEHVYLTLKFILFYFSYRYTVSWTHYGGIPSSRGTFYFDECFKSISYSGICLAFVIFCTGISPITNSNNTAPSIGTMCSDQRERNITTGLFGLVYN